MKNSGSQELFEGDTLVGTTEDTSGGGTVAYLVAAIGTEFDAVPAGG
jgi:hypothetical protein